MALHGGLDGWNPTTAQPSPWVPSAPAVALGFYLQFPSYHAPLFFFKIYLFCYGGGDYQMNKITFKW